MDFHEELRRIMALLDDPLVSAAEKKALTSELERLLKEYEEKKRQASKK